LASELAVKRHEDGIAWVLADRALTAAKNSGDAATIAASSRSAAIAMRRQGHHNGAIDLLTDAALDLDADRGDPPAPLLSAFGSLLCTASYSAAQHGKSAQAVQLIEEAEQTAQRLGETIPSVGIARFSSTNVAIYRIGVHTALGESGTALSYARSIDLGQLPTAERRARCLIDTAKACERHGDISRASQALGLAERCAPEEIQRPSVRTLISGMLYAPGPTPTDLRPLAIRAGAAR
ncbi:MAG: helix-turn-helix domain-containing protein, partial [Sciscionella sp.]